MEIFNATFVLLSKLLALQVTVDEGILEGSIVKNPYGRPFYSFKGIPYAEPPLGELRFKAPVPKTPWEGVRYAKEHAPKCFQYDVFLPDRETVGSEDCLYLNVYTPNMTPENPLPVMLWIHGGGFASGSGNVDEYSPEHLIRKDVVVVTINYRLEILGFLCLDTEDVPGNAGMKDQVAAMRWVKKNIQKFGGDPDNITIFGQSAGGASVSLHAVSPMSKGLFTRGITQSGVLTCWWATNYRARDRALVLARKLGCNSKDDKEIIACLRAQPIENLVKQRIHITYAHQMKPSPFLYYGLVSERQFGDNEIFFSGHPYDTLRNGIHEGVQIMNGYMEDDGSLYFTTGINPDEVFYQANNFTEFFVPSYHVTNTAVDTQMDIGKIFKEYYMGDKVASKNTLDDMLKYFIMDFYAYPALALQKIITKTSKSKHYLYKFTCKSELNVFANLSKIDNLFDYRTLAGHTDDNHYLFPLPPEYFKVLDMNSRSFKMVDQVTTLWTNFAKYGDPTPDDSLCTKWLPYTLENQEVLVIGEELIPDTFPEPDYELWENNFREFLPKLVP